jgi:hypothetical protein
MHLSTLPYHVKVKEHFYQQTKTWQFFASAKTKDDQLVEFKAELLKNTYKFDPVSDAAIYDKVKTVKQKLGLEGLPVTVYQAQYTDELNASIVYLKNEAHVVFSGKITQLLNEEELLAVLAHELTHIKLYSMLDGEMEVADRIITSIANNHNVDASYYETARLFKLYTEIFCDRGAFAVVGDTRPVITSLVKLATSLDNVNAESYIKQADEIFSIGGASSQANAISHPENFIRAKAVDLWSRKNKEAEEEIIKMIEGTAQLDQLDIFKQKELTKLTRDVLQLYLKPKWFQTSMVIGLAKQYFADFSLNEAAILTPRISQTITDADNSVKEYLSYILLDFSLLDPMLEEIPMGWAFQFAEDIELKEVFDNIIKKELKLSDKKLQQHKAKMLAAYHDVKESEAEQIYEA